MKISRVVPVALLATVISATLVACSSESPAASPSPTPSVMPFSIVAPPFEVVGSNPCEGQEVVITAENYSFKISPDMNPPLDSNPFCGGAIHTWTGTVPYANYTFTSDADTPLQFEVTSEGYLYLGGSGTVAEPDGTVVTLPVWSD